MDNQLPSYAKASQLLNVVSVMFVVVAFVVQVRVSYGAEQSFDDSVVVTCRRGDGPGEFYYKKWYDSTHPTRSEDFAVDIKGNVYIPEMAYTDTHSESEIYLRIHIFDKDGRFIKTIYPKDFALIEGIAVDNEGHVFLITKYKQIGRTITKYDLDGNIDFILDEDGHTTLTKPYSDYNPASRHDFNRLRSLYVLTDGSIHVKTDKAKRYPNKSQYVIYSKDGLVLAKGKGTTSDSIGSRVRDMELEIEAKIKTVYPYISKQYEGKPEGNTVCYSQAPDGTVYYMRYTDLDKNHIPQTLEIHKVVAKENKAPDK